MTTTDTTGQLEPAEVLRLVHARPIARIAFTVRERPYALPLNYACDDEGEVVFRSGDHSLLAGLNGRHVAVQLDGYDIAQRAGWCVLITGRVLELTGRADQAARQLLRLDVVRWAPGPRDR